MTRVIDAQPTILFDEEGNKIENPTELEVGNLFYISQNEPLASGEPARNPFDIPPSFLDILEIQNTYFPEFDLLLIRVTEIHDAHTGTCRVEAEIDDADEVLRRFKEDDEILSDHNYNIRNYGGKFDVEKFHGSLNKLLNDYY